MSKESIQYFNAFAKMTACGSLLMMSALVGMSGLLNAADKPNVILIICDDLNDYVEGFDGHPNARTPNMARLARSGVSFAQAHCNIPICAPSRASLFTGIYPHNSGCFGFERWDTYEVLRNSRTIMDHFRANGYTTLGTGKLMHHMVRNEWKQYGNPADYGPFASDGEEKLAHPDVPSPFREIGAVDGSFGPLVNLAGRKTPGGKPFSWQTGGWGRVRPLRVDSQDDRDLTADELNGNWAVENIKSLADRPGGQPFFMGVGFIRPHTPLIVPQRFFDMFPLDTIELPVIRPGDVEDTHARSVRGIPNGAESDSPRTHDMGSRLFTNLVASYKSRDDALRRFIQAYLASVASVDEQIGRILDAVDQSSLKDNTIIVLTSDHGWGMGEKDYLYKWRMKYDPSKESYSLRSRDWRYIRYENGNEELYHTAKDPHEWTNLADKPEYAARLDSLRDQLSARLPEPGTIPPQPAWKPKERVSAKKDAEAWRAKYFLRHPEADANKDGNLTWPELKAHREKIGDQN